MKDEIKEIIESSRKIIKSNRENGFDRIIMLGDDIDKLSDHIINLQEANKRLQNRNIELVLENDRLKENNNAMQEEMTRTWKKIDRLKQIVKKMHTWIFLNSGDEQKVYDELGLTDEENAMLGYSGQFKIRGDDKDE